jgi:hypothetical protein
VTDSLHAHGILSESARPNSLQAHDRKGREGNRKGKECSGHPSMNLPLGRPQPVDNPTTTSSPTAAPTVMDGRSAPRSNL